MCLQALKKLLLGSASLDIPEEWNQSLEFCDLPDSLFGLIQHHTGPSAVFAVVQAYLLIQMLYTGDPSTPFQRYFDHYELCVNRNR